MTKIKKITAIGAMVLVIGATSITAFAASKYSSNLFHNTIISSIIMK
jgi:hypothetical protein